MLNFNSVLLVGVCCYFFFFILFNIFILDFGIGGINEIFIFGCKFCICDYFCKLINSDWNYVNLIVMWGDVKCVWNELLILYLFGKLWIMFYWWCDFN